ncbi:GHMP family kinase ATP-binding protein [Enterococcus sp. AZ109]|uniref:GHMP family kinase ATP-binding protein n=1 Tax=Enterococcus sp. AZ109 TaxID=2774634 RepID=UPI003F206C44
MRQVMATCPGSCGELLQGWVGDSQKLVSYGIDSFSRITVSTGRWDRLLPKKIQAAAKKTVQHLEVSEKALEKLMITVDSDLPIAKGMSSSTADIAATCQAVAAYFNKTISREEILAICLGIERTDSILFPSLTLFEQQTGSSRAVSGWCPQFYVIVLEPEQEVLTEECHSPQVEHLVYQQRQRFHQVYCQYLEAVEERSLQKLGKTALLSARLNQEILPKPYFNELVKLSKQFDLLGVNVAHSGSVVGLLVEEKQQIPRILSAIQHSALSCWYTRIKVHKSYYQGVQLA